MDFTFAALHPYFFYGIFPAWRLFLTSYTVSCSQPFTSSHCLIEFLFISDLSLTLFSFCFCLKHQPSEERENFSFVCLFPFFFFVVGTRQKAIEWLLWDLECFYDEGFWEKPRQKRWRSCSWNGIVKVGVLIRGGFLFFYQAYTFIDPFKKFDCKASVFMCFFPFCSDLQNNS